jgi:hypothetical protein
MAAATRNFSEVLGQLATHACRAQLMRCAMLTVSHNQPSYAALAGAVMAYVQLAGVLIADGLCVTPALTLQLTRSSTSHFDF